MQPLRSSSIRLSRWHRAICAGLVTCSLLGGYAHAQSPQTGTPPGSVARTGVEALPAGSTVSPSAVAQSANAPTPSPPVNAPPAVSRESGQPQTQSPVPPVDVAPALLPQDLTPWGMFMSADVIVKAVMIGLIFASLLTWTIWLAKTLELMAARRRLAGAHGALEGAYSLAEAATSASLASPQVARLIESAEGELRRSPDRRDIDGIKERIAARFERIEAAVGRQMQRGTGILATIGATAPFVGLFGTVWGIMNSFIGISKLHTTNLAVVAPGIAEALLATAFGLAAAIPAVVIYNMFSRSIAQYRALYADTSVEIMTLVSRDLVQRPERYPAVVPAAE